jgi:hypothetical protein
MVNIVGSGLSEVRIAEGKILVDKSLNQEIILEF